MPDINELEIPENINAQLNETLGIEEEVQTEYTPLYKMYGDNKIPVSKAECKLWHTRQKQGLKVMEDVTDQWDLAYKYFNADQVDFNDRGEVEFRNSSKLRKTCKNSQNLVWCNNISLIPALYSQDPTIEVTNNKDKDELAQKQSTMLERLINVLFKKKSAPGLHIKKKVRKSILNALLTNRGIIKIGWTFQIDGTERALQEMEVLSQQLVEAKDVKEIKELEGKLQALEELVNYTQKEGPFAKHVRPFDLIVDPNALEQDGTDAEWIMEREWIPTEYLKAKFGHEEAENDDVKSIYAPDVVLPIGNKDKADDDSDVLSTVDDEQVFNNYGYDNAENYKRSCLTECYWVWDKIKRRVYLFSNSSWEYPIWVWNDPYNLEEFYPYYILNFYENPNSAICKGETSYYLDQQDTINMINDQLQKMREFGFNHFLFDTNSGIDKNDIQKWANGGKNILGVKLPPNKKWEDILFNGQLPSDKTQQLYDKSDIINTIDMITGTDATTRTGEYKTNTTNFAIQSYMAGKTIKLDDKRDAIETWLGEIGWGIAQLCLQFMEKDQVESLIGIGNADLWENVDPQFIPVKFSLQCVGGSTQKPTSDFKKQEALQISQVLGQFASASPYVVIVMLQVLQRALDEVVVKEEDIEMIKNSILQQMQAQQMQAQQQAALQDAQANKAEADALQSEAQTAQMMTQPSPAEQILTQLQQQQ